MGPVSFESLDAGPDRALTLAQAGRLDQAGIRVVAITRDRSHRFCLVVGSADAARAREILGLGTVGRDDPAHPDDRTTGDPS